MSGLVLLVACGAVYRLTLLATRDVITKPVRDRITGRYIRPSHECRQGIVVTPDAGWRYSASCSCGIEFVGNGSGDVALDINQHLQGHAGEMTRGPRWLSLLDCPWCASVWIAMPVVWSAWCFGDRAWWFVPAAMLFAAGITGIGATYAAPES